MKQNSFISLFSEIDYYNMVGWQSGYAFACRLVESEYIRVQIPSPPLNRCFASIAIKNYITLYKFLLMLDHKLR